MSATISQKEYIKRYLSKSDDKKKRKKKKRDVSSQSKLRIVDDDIDLSSMRPVGDDELELYNLDEDAPQVAGIVDERPEELRTMEEFRTSKRWKVVSDSTSDIIITELNASPGSNNHENNVTKKRSSVRGRRGSEGAESEDSSLQHSIRDSKKHREDSDASPPRKSRAPSSSKSCLEKAPALQIKSERITDSDSDISVSRKSDFRHRNEREPEVSKKHYVKQELPDSHKGAHDNSKKKPLQNYSDRRHHMFQGEDTKTKNPSSKERWKNDAKSDSYTHGKDFPKQNQYHRSETLSERNHNEFHRGMLLKDGKTFSNPKNESDEDSDSDLPLPRKSRKTERGKHSSYEQKKENRKKELDKGSDSDLSLPRPSMLTDKEKNKKREKVKKKHRKKDTSEQSDYDLSPPQHSGSRYREKQKRPEEVKKIHRRKGSSKESDSDLSLPRPSKSKEKHKRPEAKKRYRKKGSSEESVSDLSPLLPSKSNEKCRRQEVKKSNRKKGSSEDSDSDLSVPRQSNSTGREKLTMQEVKKRHRKRGLSEHSDSDFSPPRHAEIRGREKQKKSEVKKRRRKKGSSEESDSDLSLPRPSKSKEKHKRLEDVKKRHRKKGSSEESVSDSSPSQISKSRDRLKYNNVEEVHKKYNRKESSGKGSDSNSSPQPSKNKGGNKHGIADERANVNDRSNLDIRISQSRQKDIEKSYQRKAQSAYSKKKLNNSDSSGPQTPERSNRYDHSPVGGKRSNSRACSPEERHARKHDSHSISSRREARHRSNSPPRRQPHSDHKSDRNSSVRNSRSPEAGNRKLQKTLDGKRAGLQDAKLLREELKSFAERENNMFSKMSDDVSGRLAEAVQRDRKTGKKRDLDEEARQQKEKEEKDRKFKEKYSRWGKGLKQVEEQKRNVEEAMKLMAKPLARYADDEDLDKHLRDQEREGDPMLEYIRSKKSGSSDSKTTAKLKYQGSYPTNRFSIPPGYRWDGVDRSNGYEKQWFEQRSAQKAREEEAYKWSSADM